MTIPHISRARNAYFKCNERPWKIEDKRYLALKHGSETKQVRSFENYLERVRTETSPWEADVTEPISIDYDLRKEKPFGDNFIKRDVKNEIDILRNKLDKLTKATSKKYLRKLKTEYRKHRRTYRDALYAMWRLSIAQKVTDNLESLNVTIPEVLALYRTEGDLNVPLSLEAMYFGLEPNPLGYTPYGGLAYDYHGIHQTFFVEKHTEEKMYRSMFQEEIRAAISSREFMEKNISRKFNKSTPIQILQAGKENANQYWMSALAGLDFYMHRDLPARLNWGELRKLFSYQYARFRIKAGFSDSFADLRSKGERLYDQICSVSKKSFTERKVWTNSIVCTTYYERKNVIFHHFLPVLPVDYVTSILTEGTVRFEAYRRTSLICGGMRFDSKRDDGEGQYEILPASLAYIRYNMWDIYFALFVLDVMDKILHNMKINSDSKKYLWELKRHLSDFHKTKREDVWTVLNNWNKESNFLREEYVIKRRAIRGAIYNDAKDDSQIYSEANPGDNEKNLIAKLNGDGKLNTVIPLIDAITKNGLWGDFEKAIFTYPIINMKLRYGSEIRRIKRRFRAYLRMYSSIFKNL